MEKIFEAEYGSDLAKKVADWIEKQTFDESGGVSVYRPTAIVRLYDQLGDPVKEKSK